MAKSKQKRINVGHRIGKYKLTKRIGVGAFGVVYEAYDDIEGKRVALKIHNEPTASSNILHYFKQEIRLLAKVDHPNVLKLRNADVYDGRLFIVSELGRGSLAERRGIRLNFALSVLQQILGALVEVQKHNIVHRDIKPGNIIVFRHNLVKLGDFGIAKVLERAGHSIATDAGTHGYFAPEQIYGRPSFASDVFSMGIVFYEMTTGELPRWPFQWPFEGADRFRRRVPLGVRRVIRRAVAFDERERYPNAHAMYDELISALNRPNGANTSRRRMMPWRRYRELEFSTRYTKLLDLNYKCGSCNGPISEFMMHCPWCGTDKNSFKGVTSFNAVCNRCDHGVKDEWDYCPWCYRKKFAWADVWASSDRRYVKKCPNRSCSERKIMRWMRYCPWCHVKLKPWIIPQLAGRCKKCRWSIASDFWDYCAWCGTEVT